MKTYFTEWDDINLHQLRTAALLQHLVDLQTRLVEGVTNVADLDELQFRIQTLDVARRRSRASARPGPRALVTCRCTCQ